MDFYMELKVYTTETSYNGAPKLQALLLTSQWMHEAFGIWSRRGMASLSDLHIEGNFASFVQ